MSLNSQATLLEIESDLPGCHMFEWFCPSHPSTTGTLVMPETIYFTDLDNKRYSLPFASCVGEVELWCTLPGQHDPPAPRVTPKTFAYHYISRYKMALRAFFGEGGGNSALFDGTQAT